MMVESKVAVKFESLSKYEYPCFSKHSRRAGMNLTVMKASSFLPLRFDGGVGGVKA